MKAIRRLSLVTQFSLLLLVLMVVLAVAVSVIGRSLMVSQTLNEGRSVADMAEHIGKWGAQYGGVSVRVAKGTPNAAGSFLERRVYGLGDEEARVASSFGADPFFLVKDANRDKVEVYYSKNPALVQREVSDIAAASKSNAKFRLTAKSVLNQANAPNPFENEALNAIATSGATEYFKVQGNQLMYARSVIAGKACIRCHDSADNAPVFIKTNMQFNGGGGFGYKEGKPAGIISVSIPMPETTTALASSLTLDGWLALLALAVTCVLILLFVGLRVIAPLGRVRRFAEALSNTAVSARFQVPSLDDIDPKSANEVDRLALAVSMLGESVRVLFERVLQARR